MSALPGSGPGTRPSPPPTGHTRIDRDADDSLLNPAPATTPLVNRLTSALRSPNLAAFKRLIDVIAGASVTSAVVGEERRELARAHLWQPFSRPDGVGQDDGPVVFTRGEGIWLFDSEGRRFLDGVGALEAMAIGHGRKRLAQVAAEQMERLAFLDVFRYTSEPAIDLAAELVRIAPQGLRRVHFTPGGSEAVEVALKLAFQYHHLRGEPGRRRVITRQGAYHGVTFGAMACDGGYYSTRNDIYLPDGGFGAIAKGPAGGPGWGGGARHTAGVDGFAAQIAALGAANVAAVIVDPVATASGVAVPPAEDLRAIRALCDEYGILLIVDEVITGFCRTGAMFASQLHGVRPDLMPVSKALSSGYLPIGATLISERVEQVFAGADADGLFAHGHTYGGHPVACAVALENLRILQEERLHERAAEMGERLRVGLATLSGHRSYVDSRGIGMLNGLEIAGDAASGLWLRKRCRDLGLVTLTVHPGTVLLLAPPLVIQPDEVDRLIEILDEALTGLDAELALR